MWKARIRDALPLAAAGLTWWLTDGALVRLQSRYNDACSVIEEHRIAYICRQGDDYELLAYTCFAASIFAGYVVWYLYCRPYQERS